MDKRKILYSPGFGAGWTSWEGNPEIKAFMLEYKPLVEAVERGEDLTTALALFEKECQEKFGDVPYLGGADGLTVIEVSGRVRINEYDGSESVEEEGSYSEWI